MKKNTVFPEEIVVCDISELDQPNSNFACAKHDRGEESKGILELAVDYGGKHIPIYVLKEVREIKFLSGV